MTAFSFPRQASAKANKVAASIVKLAKELGMSAQSRLIRSSFVSHSHTCSNQFTMLLSQSLWKLWCCTSRDCFWCCFTPRLCCFPAGLFRLCLCKYTGVGLYKDWLCSSACPCFQGSSAPAFPCTCTSAVLVQGGCSWHPVFFGTHDGPQGEARTRTQLTSAPVPPIGWEWLVSVRYLHPSCFQWRL